jgi:hypothetical protein
MCQSAAMLYALICRPAGNKWLLDDSRIYEIPASFVVSVENLERCGFVTFAQLRLPCISKIHSPKTEWTDQDGSGWG